MEPKTNTCGICKNHGVIGLTIYVWPEYKFTHLCVDCCIELFPTFLTTPRSTVTFTEAVAFIDEINSSENVNNEEPDQDYFFKLIKEKNGLKIETKFYHVSDAEEPL